MISTNLQGFIATHQYASFLMLLMCQEFKQTTTPLLPFLGIFVESVHSRASDRKLWNYFQLNNKQFVIKLFWQEGTSRGRENRKRKKLTYSSKTISSSSSIVLISTGFRVTSCPPTITVVSVASPGTASSSASATGASSFFSSTGAEKLKEKPEDSSVAAGVALLSKEKVKPPSDMLCLEGSGTRWLDQQVTAILMQDGEDNSWCDWRETGESVDVEFSWRSEKREREKANSNSTSKLFRCVCTISILNGQMTKMIANTVARSFFIIAGALFSHSFQSFLISFHFVGVQNPFSLNIRTRSKEKIAPSARIFSSDARIPLERSRSLWKNSTINSLWIMKKLNAPLWVQLEVFVGQSQLFPSSSRKRRQEDNTMMTVASM